MSGVVFGKKGGKLPILRNVKFALVCFIIFSTIR
jgi:hypothetical protein